LGIGIFEGGSRWGVAKRVILGRRAIQWAIPGGGRLLITYSLVREDPKIDQNWEPKVLLSSFERNSRMILEIDLMNTVLWLAS
jgi:hypothetical protein